MDVDFSFSVYHGTAPGKTASSSVIFHSKCEGEDVLISARGFDGKLSSTVRLNSNNTVAPINVPAGPEDVGKADGYLHYNHKNGICWVTFHGTVCAWGYDGVPNALTFPTERPAVVAVIECPSR
uniref:Uncharacterized protein n=1 Tax=Candidatus Kentrum sp. MB TaxID=2138164 RepID=A0A450XV71_9GAMM|nr:MAG: hypothetical protein BECKMB1821G_GA0114241_11391 [Candidatus Kentron sp. MB]VFK77660.1 MAG: hypothetical protein BECKMB1821H_GA0114242_12042 [Candidatus Kentron sp. MB]